MIAEGTSDELKDQIGGEVLEIHVEDHAELPQVTQSLAGIGTGEPNVDTDEGLLRIPVGTQGPTALLDSVRRLDEGNVRLAGVALHRPTLDDVFLSLTGKGAEDGQEPEEDAGDKGKTKRRGRKER